MRTAITLVLLLPAVLRASEAGLLQRLDAVLKGPDYKTARWGVLVVEADTGRTVFEHNADQLFAPASVTKLYSCAAAQVGLGVDHRFETPVVRRGDVKDGKLLGDLILVAMGDLTLGGRTGRDGKMAFADDDHIYATPTKLTTRLTNTDPLAGLKDLARQVKAAGVTEVTGDVLIDTRLFDAALGSGSGPGILTPIVVNDNIVDVVVRPGAKAGVPASFELVPKTESMLIDVQVDTVAKGKPTRIVTRHLAGQRYSVRGEIAEGVEPQVRICAVDDPAGFARGLFIEALRAEGVKVPASVLRWNVTELPDPATVAKLPKVASYRSPPLSEALKVTLKVSHNLYASTLPLLLAVKHGRRTLRDGMLVQGKLLADLGVDLTGISLESGAGGGDGDKVSPRVTVQLLQAMKKRSDWPAFEAALPVLGVDGTLADVVGTDSPARGKAKGKTGTYLDENLLLGKPHLRAKSLAGVMTTAAGKGLVFCIFVNDVPLPAGVTTGTREGKVIGKLCEILHQHGP